MINAQPVVVFGESGRMARAMQTAIADTGDLALVSTVPARTRDRTAIVDAIMATPDNAIVFDFTHPDAQSNLIAALDHAPRKLVTGTSGLDAGGEQRLRQLSSRVAVMRGRNFCLGAVMARQLIEMLGRFAKGWDASVHDLHHARKHDPISATARDWASAWQSGTNGRTAGISATRLGDGISEHLLMAAGSGERVEIGHKILSIDAPTAGAIAGARFLADKVVGLYDPAHMLSDSRCSDG